MFVNYLEEELKKFKKYRTLFKGLRLFATLSTSDDVRLRVSKTTYVKEHMQFQLSSLNVVLSTFENGDVGYYSSEEPVNKTTLVFVSDKQNPYYVQVGAYFKDNDSTNVKKMRVSELPELPGGAMDLSGVFEVVSFLDNANEMKIVARFLNDNNFYGTINVVDPTKDILNPSELQFLLAKKGVKGKSVYSGVKNNVEENKYPEYSKPCEKQVIETLSAWWGDHWGGDR